ncbi:MAG: ATP-binding protein [Brumimicrobium sp.]
MKTTIKITLVYLLFGTLWILLSDNLLNFYFDDSEVIDKHYFQIIKGVSYVLVTGVLLYVLIRKFKIKEDEKIKELEQLNIKLKEEQKKMKISNEQLEHFADVASHDLKSPLRTISTLIQRFKTKFEDHLTDESSEYLEIIENSSKKLYNKIDDTLRFSKMHHTEEMFETVDLNLIVQNIIKDFETNISDKNAVIKVEEFPKINSSKTLLYQVFQNLIDNAIKYSKSNASPVITVGTLDSKSEENWTFYVKDEGIGIDLANHKKIFDRYHRVDENSQNEGSGIGLSIVSQIIEKLNGKVWIESELNKGTTIYFTIPK